MGILTSKLSAAETKLMGLTTNRPPDSDSNVLPANSLSKKERAKYAMQRSHLDKTIDDIEMWQRVSFNPLWFTVIKAQTQQIDQKLDHAKTGSGGQGNNIINEAIAVRNPLRKASFAHVFLPSRKLESVKTADITFSSVTAVQIDNKWRLLDSVSNLPKEAVRNLAIKLKSSNPSTFGLLTCIGAVHNEAKGNFNLVFRIPENMAEPGTLRAKIMARDSKHSLSDRFRLATQLARAVCSIHTFDIVHKSIRPENIILFKDHGSVLGSAFLLGFERIRKQDDNTRLTEDIDWEKNLYRHPQRQGSRIQDRYIMQHDIYSLGVCMLEIGLWTSFVHYEDSAGNPMWSESYDMGTMEYNHAQRPELIKTYLLSLATDTLPGKMGTKYARIVESCLTCLDIGNEDFGDESEFEDAGTMVAVRYIEKVSSLTSN
jgi:hypothetical protein